VKSFFNSKNLFAGYYFYFDRIRNRPVFTLNPYCASLKPGGSEEGNRLIFQLSPFRVRGKKAEKFPLI